MEIDKPQRRVLTPRVHRAPQGGPGTDDATKPLPHKRHTSLSSHHRSFSDTEITSAEISWATGGYSESKRSKCDRRSRPQTRDLPPSRTTEIEYDNTGTSVHRHRRHRNKIHHKNVRPPSIHSDRGSSRSLSSLRESRHKLSKSKGNIASVFPHTHSRISSKKKPHGNSLPTSCPNEGQKRKTKSVRLSSKDVQKSVYHKKTESNEKPVKCLSVKRVQTTKRKTRSFATSPISPRNVSPTVSLRPCSNSTYKFSLKSVCEESEDDLTVSSLSDDVLERTKDKHLEQKCSAVFTYKIPSEYISTESVNDTTNTTSVLKNTNTKTQTLPRNHYPSDISEINPVLHLKPHPPASPSPALPIVACQSVSPTSEFCSMWDWGEHNDSFEALQKKETESEKVNKNSFRYMSPHQENNDKSSKIGIKDVYHNKSARFKYPTDSHVVEVTDWENSERSQSGSQSMSCSTNKSSHQLGVQDNPNDLIWELPAGCLSKSEKSLLEILRRSLEENGETNFQATPFLNICSQNPTTQKAQSNMSKLCSLITQFHCSSTSQRQSSRSCRPSRSISSNQSESRESRACSSRSQSARLTSSPGCSQIGERPASEIGRENASDVNKDKDKKSCTSNGHLCSSPHDQTENRLERSNHTKIKHALRSCLEKVYKSMRSDSEKDCRACLSSRRSRKERHRLRGRGGKRRGAREKLGSSGRSIGVSCRTKKRKKRRSAECANAATQFPYIVVHEASQCGEPESPLPSGCTQTDPIIKCVLVETSGSRFGCRTESGSKKRTTVECQTSAPELPLRESIGVQSCSSPIAPCVSRGAGSSLALIPRSDFGSSKNSRCAGSSLALTFGQEIGSSNNSCCPCTSLALNSGQEIDSSKNSSGACFYVALTSGREFGSSKNSRCAGSSLTPTSGRKFGSSKNSRGVGSSLAPTSGRKFGSSKNSRGAGSSLALTSGREFGSSNNSCCPCTSLPLTSGQEIGSSKNSRGAGFSLAPTSGRKFGSSKNSRCVSSSLAPTSGRKFGSLKNSRGAGSSLALTSGREFGSSMNSRGVGSSLALTSGRECNSPEISRCDSLMTVSVGVCTGSAVTNVSCQGSGKSMSDAICQGTAASLTQSCPSVGIQCQLDGGDWGRWWTQCGHSCGGGGRFISSTPKVEIWPPELRTWAKFHKDDFFTNGIPSCYPMRKQPYPPAKAKDELEIQKMHKIQRDKGWQRGTQQHQDERNRRNTSQNRRSHGSKASQGSRGSSGTHGYA